MALHAPSTRLHVEGVADGDPGRPRRTGSPPRPGWVQGSPGWLEALGDHGRLWRPRDWESITEQLAREKA